MQVRRRGGRVGTLLELVKLNHHVIENHHVMIQKIHCGCAVPNRGRRVESFWWVPRRWSIGVPVRRPMLPISFMFLLPLVMTLSRGCPGSLSQNRGGSLRRREHNGNWLNSFRDGFLHQPLTFVNHQRLTLL